MDILAIHAENQPTKPAVICGDETTTFAELEDRANRLANALLAEGVQRLDKVTTVGYNAPEQAVIGAAARKIGAVGVPMNYRLRPTEMQYQLDNSETAVVFSGPDQVDAVESCRDRLGDLKLAVAWGRDTVPEGWRRFEDLLAAGDPSAPEVEAEAFGPTMSYTAGTTGKPKGAYRATGLDTSILTTWIQAFELSGEDVHLVAGPLYHSAPGAFATLTTVLGGTNVLMRRFDPAEALALIERHRVRTTFMAPTLLQRIVDLPDEVKQRHDLSSMHVIIVAAAPCPFELKRRVMELFGDVLYEFYGSSEAGVNTLLRPEEQLTRPGSCGRPVEGVDVKILDEEGQEVPTGTPGEIYVSSPAIITSYYRNEDETRGSWHGEHFSVGDVGYLDEDGYLYISDRKRDMIISGGANIYSAEVENAIHDHPDVQDVVVFGIPSEEWGEQVHAIVQPQPGAELTADDVISWTAERLADYKKPRSVEFHDDLPRDEAGKIRKRELRDPHWEGRERRI